MTEKELIQLVNDQINHLKESSFIKWMEGNNYQVRLGNIIKGEAERKKTRNLPDWDIIVTFITLVRPFFLKRDAIDLRKLSKAYKNHKINKHESSISKLYNEIEDFLKSKPRVSVTGFNMKTNKKIMETFFYGKIFHITEEAKLRNEHKKWAENDFNYDFILHWLCMILAFIYQELLVVEKINLEALKDLTS